MPDALELPRMLIAIVEHMSRERFPSLRRSVVHELVALAFGHSTRPLLFTRWRARLDPGFAAVLRALKDLPKPAAALRSVNAVRVHRGTLEVIHLPTGKMRPTDLP